MRTRGTTSITTEIRQLVESVKATKPADTQRRLDELLRRMEHLLGDDIGGPHEPFPSDLCGCPGDEVRNLSDYDLLTAGKALFDLAREHGSAARRSDGTPLGQYLTLLAFHPASERQRRGGVRVRAKAELMGGHRVGVVPGPGDDAGAWAAQCWCGWEGEHRLTRVGAEDDAEAHLAPHIPEWMREGAS